MRGRLDQALGGMQSDTEPALRERAAKLRKAIKELPKPEKIEVEEAEVEEADEDKTSDLGDSDVEDDNFGNNE